MGVWGRAAALGSLWAASEIVLGSFLHNLRVPFRGHFMTALSILLLSAAQRARPGRGLLWRAGLVTAALKSVSPSAVLLGPMLAIAAEGLWMELGAVLLGGGAAGAVLGGGLAMAWIPVHLSAMAVLVYGNDAAALFVAAWGKVQAAAGLEALGLWGLFGLVGLAHFALGAAAAWAGWGASAAGCEVRLGAGAAAAAPRAAAPGRFSPSPLGAALNLAALVLLMLALRGSSPAASAALSAAALASWALLYPAVLGRLKRPGLWLGLLLAGAGAGAFLGADRSEGALIGLKMGLRALALTAGFAAVGRELSAPFFRERLPAAWLSAIEAAFAALPGLVARLPAPGDFLRRPRACVAALLRELPESLGAAGPSVHIVTGAVGSGKSSFVQAVVAALRTRGVSVGGVLAAGLWESGVRAGFDAVDLASGERFPLCRRQAPASWTEAAGSYRFSPAGLAFGRRALERAVSAGVAIVDEVGPLELAGGGWAPALERLCRERTGPMLWVVREPLAAAVRERWGLQVQGAWTAADDPAALARALT